MGKAGCQIGGRSIDGWLYEDLLIRADIHDVDARAASWLFMLEVEKIKERLSSADSYPYNIEHAHSKLKLKGKYFRGELEEILEKKGFYHSVQQTIERALNTAREKGVARDDIKEVLLVGGTSQMPSVKRQLTMNFGDKTRNFRPYDAVARGACRYLTSDIDKLYDYIQHDYAIKSYDSKSGAHRFIPLVPKGTRYPTINDFKKLSLKAASDGQRFFGIDIYEIAEKGSINSSTGNVIFDRNGGIVFQRNTHEADAGTEFWMNEEDPLFIESNPPGEKGVNRFSVTFRVDAQKRLLVTVRDIQTQKPLYLDHPVVKLK